MTDTIAKSESQIADAAGAVAPVASPDGSERRQGLGGADMAAILDLSGYSDKWSVWAEKCGVDTGQEFADSPESRWGLAAEDALAAWYTAETGVELSPGQFVRHPEHPIVQGHTDRMIGDDGIVEFKTDASPGAWNAWGEEGTDEIPFGHLVQCQWYLFASGRRYCVVIALVCGRILIYRVEADPELHALLLVEAQEFWGDYVLTNTPPPEDGSKGATRVLRALGVGREDITIEADGRAIEMARQYEVARLAKVAAALEHDRRKQIVMRYLNDAGATVMRGDGWRLTYRTRFTPTLEALRPEPTAERDPPEPPATPGRAPVFAIPDFSVDL